MNNSEIKLNNHTIELSSLDKLMFPDSGITKGDLIDYYRRIADTMLPHVRQRPVTMHRFPDGIDETGFYQKEAPDYFPDWIDRVSIYVEEEDAAQPQIVCNSAAALVYLANQGCITPHVWLSRVDKLDHPDKLIFDLDPPSDDFGIVREAALALRRVLDELHLRPFVMTTGQRGLHVVVPLDRSADFDTVRAFSRDVADVVAERNPDRFTTASRKKKRRGRLFLDYLRNSYGQHGVAPYAVRPRRAAPVSTPLDWDELHDQDLTARSYTIGNIFRRLGQKDDPWADMYAQAAGLEDARQRLEEMSDGQKE